MKKLVLALFALIFTFSLVPLSSFAQNTVTQTTTLPSDEVVENDYFVANDRVIVSGTIEGDVYAAAGDLTFEGNANNDLLVAGGNVIITGTIAQDVRVAGGNVTLAGAEIGGSVAAAGGTITIDSATSIGGSVTAMGGNIQLMSPVGGGLTVVGGNVVVGGDVGGDVWAPGVGSLRLSSDANVAGDLTYTSSEEVLVAQEATVSGEISRQAPPQQQTPETENIAKAFAGFAFALWLSDLIVTLLLGLAFVFFMPNFVLRATDNVSTRLGTSFLIGLLIIIVTPIILLLLMLTLVGIPLALTFMVIFFFVVWVAKIFGAIALGRKLLSSKKKDKPFGSLFLGVGIYFALSIIPLVGGLIQAFITLSGLGGLFLTKKEYYNELRKKNVL